MTKKLLILLSLFPLLGLSQEPNTDQIIKMANLGDVLPYHKNDTIPITIYNDVIVLRVNVNDKPLNLMWDNGFSFSAIDKKVSSKVKLNNYEQQESVTVTDGTNNQVKMDIKIADSVTLKNYVIKNSPFLITDIQSLIGNSDQIQGIVGATIIKKLNWSFNFDENYVVISQKPFQKDGITIPFQLNPYNRMYTSLTLNGTTNGVEIDFGSNSDGIDLTIEAIGLFKNSKKSEYKGVASVSVSGEYKFNTSYTIKDFDYNIGGVTFPQKLKLHLSPNEGGARIGNKFFRNYNVVFNMVNSEIILSKREKELIKTPDKSYGYTIILLDGNLIVGGLQSNPNITEDKGLKVGDIILKINDKTKDDFMGNADLKEHQLQHLLQDKSLIIETKTGDKFILEPLPNIYE